MAIPATIPDGTIDLTSGVTKHNLTTDHVNYVNTIPVGQQSHLTANGIPYENRSIASSATVKSYFGHTIQGAAKIKEDLILG